MSTHIKKFAPSILAAIVSAGVVAGGAYAADDRGDAQQANRVAVERTAMVRAHVADTARQAAAAATEKAKAVKDGRERMKRHMERKARTAKRTVRREERERAQKLADRARGEGFSSGSSQGYASGSSAGYASGSQEGFRNGLEEASDELTCSDDLDVALPFC